MYRIKIDRSRCIGCLTCVTACVVSHGSQAAADVLTQIAGIQIFLTTMIIGYVLLRFLMMFLRTPERGDCHGNRYRLRSTIVPLAVIQHIVA